jgi:RHH-type transcriptional regulator, proline utilization regulon repressor / proline dehydrogenase / delta 1-pyrroline-5-carboxylate dehydrogenase
MLKSEYPLNDPPRQALLAGAYSVMRTLPLMNAPAASTPRPEVLETAIRQWGEKLFSYMDQAGAPSIFTAKGLYGALMDWAMKDETFKVQLFRFVDVLPTLTSSGEVSRHLTEYLDNDQVNLSPPLRAALKATGLAGGLLGGGIRSQVTGMARLFMLGSDPKEISTILRKLSDADTAFTVDVLGEAVVSEKEAEDYAARYLDLMDLLAREAAAWPAPCSSDVTPSGAVPRLNISVKLSAFYSQIHATDPDTALEKLSARLRPVLRRARDLGAFICVDMESYALKNLTLRVFKSVFSEAEFARGPECGLALQAYLKDCEADLREMVAWARAQKRRITIRLVKGAYWDYETVIARQRGWPIPVFERKAETDASFEKLSLYLLENLDAVGSAFASHNIRSLANVLAQADRLGRDRRAFEMQVLYGMADTIKAALLQAGCRVRAYCPVGELLPGMAYLVRRLLENTSNEGFLANKFAKGATREALLRNPLDILCETVAHPAPVPPPSRTNGVTGFQNEPPTDFTIGVERDRVLAAFRDLRTRLGGRHPLVIGGKRVETRDWAPSLNPANQQEIIGYSARATVGEAEAALAAARAAQGRWARTPVAERARLFDTLGGLMRRDKAALIALMVLEAGKNWTEADGDVAEAIDFCCFNAAVMRELGRPRRTQRVAGETNYQEWWPRGIGIIVSPWNFPLAILTGMMSAAVVAGNAVILKPSDQTTVIAARLMELVAEAGFPAGVINLITGRGAEIGAHLIAHPQISFIAFTGSMEVGLGIWETAGRTPPGQASLKKVVCEMGGKNALIVDADADLDEAVAGTVQSAFGYNGQKCSALSRLIVLAGNHDKFVDRLVAATASLRIGPPEQPGTIIGPVIDRASQRRILAAIEAGRQEATLAWQGRAPEDDQACYVPPTVFTGVPPTSRLFREEIFGPVLSITRARDFDEAIALANDCAFALTGGLYSRSPINIERAKAELVCGNLYINRGITGAIVGRQPFGGFKMSGSGTKAGGVEYLENFMVPRVVTENCLRRGFAPVESE